MKTSRYTEAQIIAILRLAEGGVDEEIQMKKSRFTEAQIMGVLRLAESGLPVLELCRKHGISSALFDKWRGKYGGMDASMMSQMKALKDENQRLKRMFADLSMQADLLREALRKSDAASSAPGVGREGDGDNAVAESFFNLLKRARIRRRTYRTRERQGRTCSRLH